MGTPNVLFIFSTPSTQWTPLSGNTVKTGFCTPDIALIDSGSGDVSISGTANTSKFVYKGNSYTTYPAASATLVVLAGKSPKFAFNVADSAGLTNTYVLGGVALKNTAKGGGTGGSSFPSTDIAVALDGTTTLNLQNNDLAGKGAIVTYDFWVLVQNSGGDIGLIDPLVTNSN